MSYTYSATLSEPVVPQAILMKTIHKFALKITDVQTVSMPFGAEILCVQAQHDTPCLWAQVNSNSPAARTIEIFGTGHPMSGHERRYIGTVQTDGGALVWHVFERL